jgi:hypothetical protein
VVSLGHAGDPHAFDHGTWTGGLLAEAAAAMTAMQSPRQQGEEDFSIRQARTDLEQIVSEHDVAIVAGMFERSFDQERPSSGTPH